VLLERGRQIIERLFPGLSHELLKNGASILDTSEDFAILNPAGWSIQFPSGVAMLTCSRDLLDWHVRRRLQNDERIHFEQEVEVTRLVPDDAGSGICGVALRARGIDNRSSQDVARNAAGERILNADLVVDASGRGSRAPQWLESLGYGRPAETIVDAHLGYATRLFRRPAEVEGRKGMFIQASPPTSPRSGVVVPIEGDRWIVTVCGGDGNYPPADGAGFLEFARGLRSSAIYDAIKGAEPLSPVFTHRGLDNRWRHFERMARWPERFIVLGDAACAFNPVYAQGITTAALAAAALGDCLRVTRHRQNRADLATAFQKKLARVVRTPWLLATGEDRRYRRTDASAPGLATRWTHRYMDRIFQIITKSATVRRRSLEVFHLLRHPITLFHPGNVMRVLAAAAGDAIVLAFQRWRDAAATFMRERPSIERSVCRQPPNLTALEQCEIGRR
jgi:2-polyprenyl-6-methoxyphenol hydroxylase-like FAD-dependent oxidoreductase